MFDKLCLVFFVCSHIFNFILFPLRDWPLHPDYFNQLLLPILFCYFRVLYFSYTCLACFCTQPLFQCLASVSVYAMVFHQILAFAHFGSVSPFGLILVFDSWVIYDCEFSFCLISDNSEACSACGASTCFLACLAQTLTFISGRKNRNLELHWAVSL